ncbi:outer membrane protein OmpW [Photobacterium sp. OFAV2-7]|uniref:outer membrane protein OmpW n=1 Tax=Photobacterium sp. OFAV2-7 TaxID=2917748 RepID=UPI001EF6C3AE|nr:outer membrane protein OmpW [Photobacterium sp. OFAV2-7]MCG7585546.1 outer membrane protein OmpW [Photobacterium sp. OFAV2-7]
MKKTVCALAVLATLSVAPQALAHKKGDFLVRAGAASVMPNESSDNVLGSLGEFGIDSNIQLGLTFGYMVTDNISVELLAATPFSHKVSLNGLGDIAEVEHLPPTLMLQYYFMESTSKWRPYVGAGLNYTTFFNEEFNSTGKNAKLSDLSLDDSWGLAANVGIDYQLKDDWFLGASVWYADIGTDVNFKADGAQQSVKTDIDPWIVMVSAGYTF